jgi:hypothetical protein
VLVVVHPVLFAGNGPNISSRICREGSASNVTQYFALPTGQSNIPHFPLSAYCHTRAAAMNLVFVHTSLDWIKGEFGLHPISMRAKE